MNKVLFTLIGVVLFTMIATFSGCVGQIDEGEEGVKLFGGKVTEESITPGYYMVMLGNNVIEYTTRSQTKEGQTMVYTKDVQTANIAYTYKYNLNKGNAGKVYRVATHDWETKLVGDFVDNALKDVMGKFEAVELVQNRDKATVMLRDLLQARVSNNLTLLGLPESAIQITAFNLNNIDLSDQFESAVEAKVTAVQEAERAQNVTVKIEEEAKQAEIQAQGEANAALAKAKAEAEAMRIKNEALTQSPKLIDFTIAEGFAKNWKGEFPLIVTNGSGNGGQVNLLDIASMMQARQK